MMGTDQKTVVMLRDMCNRELIKVIILIIRFENLMHEIQNEEIGVWT